MNRCTQRQFTFHPLTVLVISMMAAAIFALLVSLLFEGDLRWFLLYYFTPIGIPFVAFLFDRAEQYALTSTAAWGVDVVVLIPALTRAFIPIPFISGHALFLTYCLFTSKSKVARISAVLVLLQVIYLKIFVTHDQALFGGVVLGCLAAFYYRRIRPVKLGNE
jgi:hypothetical protein